MNNNDMIGQTYGKWHVLDIATDPRPGVFFLCNCGGCGTIHTIFKHSLLKGKSKMCLKCSRRNQSSLDSMIGTRFGKWLVLEESGMSFGSISYLCQCDCGIRKVLHGPALRRKQTTQCHNCAQSQRGTKHGLSGHRVYKVWSSMKHRCLNPNDKFYDRYGGRGIKVCDRWLTFENFIEDMGLPGNGLEIDRVDNNGNYCPENCRWVTKLVNMQNRYYNDESDRPSELFLRHPEFRLRYPNVPDGQFFYLVNRERDAGSDVVTTYKGKPFVDHARLYELWKMHTQCKGGYSSIDDLCNAHPHVGYWQAYYILRLFREEGNEGYILQDGKRILVNVKALLNRHTKIYVDSVPDRPGKEYLTIEELRQKHPDIVDEQVIRQGKRSLKQGATDVIIKVGTRRFYHEDNIIKLVTHYHSIPAGWINALDFREKYPQYTLNQVTYSVSIVRAQHPDSYDDSRYVRLCKEATLLKILEDKYAGRSPTAYQRTESASLASK